MSPTPTRTIDYYFSIISPWSFLGHGAFQEVVRRHGVAVAYHPVELGPVFAETGGLPLAQRAPARQHYRMVELQRWRVRRAMDFHLYPRFWPVDVSLGDRLIIAAALRGADAAALAALTGRLLAGIWQRQENVADRATLVAIADAAGLPGAELLAEAEGEAAGAVYAANREMALAADVFGAPAYVLDGEVFWGQDRLDLLDDALASGRAPFRFVAKP